MAEGEASMEASLSTRDAALARKPSVAVTEPVQEREGPVKDSVTKLDRLFWLFGKITRASRVKTEGATDKDRMERSRLTRTNRAELLTRLQSTPTSDREGRRKIFEEARSWDTLANDFLRQGEVRVSFADLGDQVARFNVLEPPPGREPPLPADGSPARELPPIVLIPGISNDLDCISTMAESLAFRGRRVISIAYPESFMGTVTDKFADTVTAKKDFSTHAQFFQAAVDALTADSPDIELWGLSTGGPIVAEMLSDPIAREKVSNAVLVSPIGCVDQTPTAMKLGIVRETLGMLKRFGSILPRGVWSSGRKTNEDSHQLELRNKIMEAHNDAIRQTTPCWQTMAVREGGNITMISGGQDEITKSYQAVDRLSAHPQLRAAILPNENHTSSFNSMDVLDKVDELQRS